MKYVVDQLVEDPKLFFVKNFHFDGDESTQKLIVGTNDP